MVAIDVATAASILGVSPRTLYDVRWRRRHRVTALRVGRLLRFREDELTRWLNRHREEHPR